MTARTSIRQRSRWRGIAFNLAFYGWTVLLLPVGAIAGLCGPAAVRAVSRFWAQGALGLLGAIAGVRHRVVGREHLPAGPVMLAIKHQSAWETIALNLVLRDPAFVLKQELTRIPVFGWLLRRAGMIAVDRDGGAAALRGMVAAARARLAEGRPIVIFPEGTRVPPGERRPYHPGVAALYGALDVPVVPVALDSGRFWPRRDMRMAGGTITLAFLPPIAPGLARRAFAGTLESAIEDAVATLDANDRDIS